MRGFRLRDLDQKGFSLVELLMAMALTLVLSLIMVTSLVSSNKLFRKTRNESVGQTDVRTTIERLGRDIRNARSLDAGASASQLVLWVDSNSDYKKQPTEIVTWALVPGTAGHFDVSRTVNGATTRTARFVISILAFGYRTNSAGTALVAPLTAPQAATVTYISSDIQYAADAGSSLAGRHTLFSERLRNVG
jgi:prepilin-type N-terminal cleavage/methylation domain-containing protein